MNDIKGKTMKLSKPGKRMIFFVCVAALGVIVVGAAVYRSIEALYFAFGVVLTSSLNVAKIYLLERTVKNTLSMDDPGIGKNYVRFQYLIRYFLTGAVLLAAGLISVYVDPPFISIWGAVAGIFTLQIAVIIVRSLKNDDE